MSDTGHEGRAWHFYVQDMIDFAEKAVAYTKGKTQAEFVADALIYDATRTPGKTVAALAMPAPRSSTSSAASPSSKRSRRR